MNVLEGVVGEPRWGSQPRRGCLRQIPEEKQVKQAERGWEACQAQGRAHTKVWRTPSLWAMAHSLCGWSRHGVDGWRWSSPGSWS